MLEPIMQNIFLLLGASPRKNCPVSCAWLNGANWIAPARSLELEQPAHSVDGLGNDDLQSNGEQTKLMCYQRLKQEKLFSLITGHINMLQRRLKGSGIQELLIWDNIHLRWQIDVALFNMQ